MEHVVETGSGFGTRVAPFVVDRAKGRARIVALYGALLVIATFTFLGAQANDQFETATFTLVAQKAVAIPHQALRTREIAPGVDLAKRSAISSRRLLPMLLRFGQKLRPKPSPNTAALPAEPRVTTPDRRQEPRRIKVRDRSGRTVVARIHGGTGGETHVMLPDGQLGVPEELTFTDEPFRPATPSEVAEGLLAGPLAGFNLKTSSHYLVFYKSTPEFAEQSARVLEGLYACLVDAFRRKEVSVHESEFPLVAVIFGTEAEFRQFREVDPQIRAYYEIYTNRIYMFETSEQLEAAPEVAALRRPQTVAHEGTHQILQNIGIQPRLAAWPPWLIEGLAEYCATPVMTRKGTAWSFLGAVNAEHLATIRDLADPDAGQFLGQAPPIVMGRKPDQPLVEYVVTRTELTPTDYALSWAVTHYLAWKRLDDFMAYVKLMSQLQPLEPRTPEQQLAVFRAAFKTDLTRLDKDINKYLGRLKVANPLPFYTMVFEQRMPGDAIRRAAIVSQSPSVIRQWLDAVTTPRGEYPSFHVFEFETKTPAMSTADAFVRGQ